MDTGFIALEFIRISQKEILVLPLARCVGQNIHFVVSTNTCGKRLARIDFPFIAKLAQHFVVAKVGGYQPARIGAPMLNSKAVPWKQIQNA